MSAIAHTALPEAAWETWHRGWAPDPDEGTHVTIIGPTGSGKTTLLTGLLIGWPWTLEVVCKRTGGDITTERAIKLSKAVQIASWPPPTAFDRRVVLWPKLCEPDDVEAQTRAIRAGLVGAFKEGKWAVICDDAQYLLNTARAGPIMELYWFHARSSGMHIAGNSLVTVWPRPAWVPLLAYSAATWLFLAGTRDRRDAMRLAEISGAGPSLDTATIVRTVQALPRFSFLTVNTRTAEMCVVHTKDAFSTHKKGK